MVKFTPMLCVVFMLAVARGQQYDDYPGEIIGWTQSRHRPVLGEVVLLGVYRREGGYVWV